jgi:hypothetical protein
VPHAETADFCELSLGRLTRGRDPTVQTMPVVDAFRVGHWKHPTARLGRASDVIGAGIFHFAGIEPIID